MKNGTLTSVKVDKSIYTAFKKDVFGLSFNLQELVNKSMYLYMNDPDFKAKLYQFVIPTLSEAAQQVELNITGSNEEVSNG